MNFRSATNNDLAILHKLIFEVFREYNLNPPNLKKENNLFRLKDTFLTEF